MLDRGRAVVAYAWRPLLIGAFRMGPEIELTATLREAATEMDEAGTRRAEQIAAAGAGLAREAGFGPVEARAVVVPGSTWRSLVDLADEVDARVIVVGAHGHSRAKEVLLGTVSSAIAHAATRPVLIVRPTPRA